MHEILVNYLGGLHLPKKCVVWLADSLDMTLDVYRGRRTTTQQQLNINNPSQHVPESTSKTTTQTGLCKTFDLKYSSPKWLDSRHGRAVRDARLWCLRS